MSLWERVQVDNEMIRTAEAKGLIKLKGPSWIQRDSRDDWKDENGHEGGPAYIDLYRWQTHVAAVAYYHFGFGTMQDETFDWGCRYLVTLQKRYPDFRGYMDDYFLDDWSGDTAFDIPVTAEVLEYVVQSALIRNVVLDSAKLVELQRATVSIDPIKNDEHSLY